MVNYPPSDGVTSDGVISEPVTPDLPYDVPDIYDVPDTPDNPDTPDADIIDYFFASRGFLDMVDLYDCYEPTTLLF